MTPDLPTFSLIRSCCGFLGHHDPSTARAGAGLRPPRRRMHGAVAAGHHDQCGNPRWSTKKAQAPSSCPGPCGAVTGGGARVRGAAPGNIQCAVPLIRPSVIRPHVPPLRPARLNSESAAGFASYGGPGPAGRTCCSAIAHVPPLRRERGHGTRSQSGADARSRISRSASSSVSCSARAKLSRCAGRVALAIGAVTASRVSNQASDTSACVA